MATLAMPDLHALNLVASFATILSTYFKGYTVVIEPSPPESALADPVLQLFCHDASFVMRPIFKTFRNVVLTGNCLQPIDTFAKVLGFEPRVRQFQMLMTNSNFGPFVMTKGAD